MATKQVINGYKERQKLHEKQLNFFEYFMVNKGIDCGYKKTYPPNSFEGKTHNMTVVDSEVGMFAIDSEYHIYIVTLQGSGKDRSEHLKKMI